MGRPGRRPGPSQTRAQILHAAREQFATQGYPNTTLRSIAAAAGVNAGLLHHFFGSKRDLYREALGLSVDPWEVLTRLLDETPREDLPEALARQFVTTWRDPVLGPRLRARARETYGNPGGTRTTRAHLQTVLIPRLAQALDVPEHNVAAALSHLIGLTLLDNVIEIEQFTCLPDSDLVQLVEPALRRYLLPSG